MLSPKFGLMEDISIINCRIQVEEALNKLRWNKIIDNDQRSTDGDLFDMNTNTIDINNLKVTSLPFNPSVMMPWSLKEEEEIKMEKFKGEVMSAVKKMKGKNRKWSNLSREEKVGMESLKEELKLEK